MIVGIMTSISLPSGCLLCWTEVLAFAVALEMEYGCMAAKLLIHLVEHCLKASGHCIVVWQSYYTCMTCTTLSLLPN